MQTFQKSNVPGEKFQQLISCNNCAAAIPKSNADGAVRLAGTTIDFCKDCSSKTVAEIAPNFKTPAAPPMKKIQLANGIELSIPAGAPVPVGAKLVS